VEGEIWILTKIVANVSYWDLITGGASGTVTALVDSLGNVVDPTLAGRINVIGDSNSIITTNGLTANTLMIIPKFSEKNSTSVAGKAGVASFNSTEFNVDGSGFVSLVGGSSEPVIQSLSDDGGTKRFPDSTGNIQIQGRYYVDPFALTPVSTVTGGTNLLRVNPMTPARWIVDYLSDESGTQWNGTHQNITSACAVATAGDTIFIMPGAYNESFTLPVGVNLQAWPGDSLTPIVTINGNITLASSADNTISGINLEASSGNCITMLAGTLYLKDCYFSINTNTILSCTNGGQIYIQSCQGDTSNSATGAIFAVSNGQIFIHDSRVFNTGSTSGSNTLPTGTGSSKFWIVNSHMQGWNFTVSSGGSFNVINSFVSNITISGSATNNNIYNSAFGALVINTGTNVNVLNSVLTSSASEPIISGGGTLSAAGLVFTNSHGVSNATTQTPLYTYGNLQLTNTIDRTQPTISLIAGTSTPGSLSANHGSIFLTNSGSSISTRMYVNTNGTTGWTNFVSAA
jgi:hypothetical protein